MKHYFIVTLTIINYVLSDNTQFVVNRKSKYMVFQFPNFQYEHEAVIKGLYNTDGARDQLPYDIDIQYFKNGSFRMFAVVPRIFTPNGKVPFTLGTFVQQRNTNINTAIEPYPNYYWHLDHENDCNSIYATINIRIDSCNRLWVVDQGIQDLQGTRICQPKLLIFNLENDKLLRRYEFPEEQIDSVSGKTALGRVEVVVEGSICNKTIAYISDFYQPAILVYSFDDDISWRIKHPTFAVEDSWSKFSFGSNNIILPYGVHSITITPDHKYLIYRALSAENEYIVSVDTLNNRNLWKNSENKDVDGFFQNLGSREDRCSTGVMDSKFNYYCIAEKYSSLSVWNLKKPEIGTQDITEDKTYLSDPGCLKIITAPDGEDELFIVKSSIVEVLTGNYNPNMFNFYVISCRIKDLLAKRKCRTYICSKGECDR
ncbi:Y-e3.2 family protein [Megaselia abdita]